MYVEVMKLYMSVQTTCNTHLASQRGSTIYLPWYGKTVLPTFDSFGCMEEKVAVI